MDTSKSVIWDLIEPLVRGAGFDLFDIEVPGGRSGVLRVFIWKGKGGTVVLDDCASVSKRIEELTQLDEMIPGSYVLEVSSPGINRKLTRPEHFAGAVGERVKLVVEEPGAERCSMKGVILSCRDGQVELQDEESKGPMQVAISAIKRAQVDFEFGRSLPGGSEAVGE
jgi:ribosome maturation factor RimP